MRPASEAASRLAGVSRPAASRASSASAMAGRSGGAPPCRRRLHVQRQREAADGGRRGQAGRTKAQSSSRSKHGRGRRPRRRSVTGAWTSKGVASPSRPSISAGVPDASSPSSVRMLARPCPATTAGVCGGSHALGAGAWGYMSRPQHPLGQASARALMARQPIDRRAAPFLACARCPTQFAHIASFRKAWPFEEAAKVAARLEASGQAGGPVRDRVRPVRPAAYRHVRRGRAHHLGAPGLHRADRAAVPAAGVQRRHGRAAQGAGQRAEPGHAAPVSSASRSPACPTRSARMTASARTTTPGCAPSWTGSASSTNSPPPPSTTVRPVRRRPAPGAGAARADPAGHPADAGAGAAGDLLAHPADPPAHRAGHAGRIEGIDPQAGTVTWTDADGERFDHARHRRRAASCSGRPIGPCAGTRWASITR